MDSRAHIFTSDTRIGEADGCALSSSNRPTAVVEVLDPMVLSSKVKDACECGTAESVTVQIPAGIRALFDEELTIPGDHRRLYVTLGQFSIVRLERDSQLLMPVFDYCMPEKECPNGSGGDDPCQLFQSIAFPVGEFFPPNSVDMPRDYDSAKQYCGCRG